MTSRPMTSSGCGEHSVTEAPRDVAPIERTRGYGCGRALDRARDAGVGVDGGGHVEPEIADELVVVLDTVKKHVGHIFDKVGAANRTQAVARARVMGLVQDSRLAD